jgi:alanyl-tRNA synthetase
MAISILPLSKHSSSSDVRKAFIEFFESKQHTFVPSSSTIPIGDATILFTIAGMAQFKAALAGQEIRPYKRATNSQKCIRIGDLDDVGKDGRHLTMFEMLGSWSFGDYYKEQAIEWAYEFVKDYLKFDLQKLWVSVHTSDIEAEQLWEKTGHPKSRIVKLGDKDNFWAMGPTGPCGPCTELHVDQGPEVGKCNDKKFDCKAGPGCDCDRFLEFWNLVFMQYDRQADGALKELKSKSVDTGAGLERMTALLQQKTNAFEIDSLVEIKHAIAAQAQVVQDNLTRTSLNVIADHIRTLCFTLSDGVTFSNTGRGYVLRRVLRRAVRHAHLLAPQYSKQESFLEKIVPVVVQIFGKFYPELQENMSRVQEQIKNEEIRFVATIESGLLKFNEFVAQNTKNGLSVLSGVQVFTLHDTFGFPADLTQILCEEMGLSINFVEFEACMQAQKDKSREDAKFYKADKDNSPFIEIQKANQSNETLFTGYNLSKNNYPVYSYEVLPSDVSRFRLLKNGNLELVLFKNLFYPEGGGQESDAGFMTIGKFKFEVVDVRKTPSHIAHVLQPLEEITLQKEMFEKEFHEILKNTSIFCEISLSQRLQSQKNHTATHLLHKALQIVLGDGVRQAGSFVSSKGLRFDFTHSKAISPQEKKQIEHLVNLEISKCTQIQTHENVPLEKAKNMGAMAIFNEKYDSAVRVLEVPSFSMELCGGTHVLNTSEIGLFKIISEGSVTAGVRRIEAITGEVAFQYLNEAENTMQSLALDFKCAPLDVVHKVNLLRLREKELLKNIEVFKAQKTASFVKELLNSSEENERTESTLNSNFLYKQNKPENTPVFCYVPQTGRLEFVNHSQELESLVDTLQNSVKGVVLVAVNFEEKINLLCAIHSSVSEKYSAGNIIKEVCGKFAGKGGGRREFARGSIALNGASNSHKEIFESVKTLLKSI